MKLSAKGEVLLAVRKVVEPVKAAEVAVAIGSESAAETAGLVPYFGPTVAGEQLLVDVLGLDLSRALLAGHSYEWARPLRPGEMVQIKVFIEDVYEKNNNIFGVVGTEIHDEAGDLVQRQRTTFIQGAAK